MFPAATNIKIKAVNYLPFDYKNNILKTVVETTPEMYCITNMSQKLENIKHNAGIIANTLLQTFREWLKCVEIYIHTLFSALIALSDSLFISLHGVEGNRVGH